MKKSTDFTGQAGYNLIQFGPSPIRRAITVKSTIWWIDLSFAIAAT
jgi:hypothetical protein